MGHSYINPYINPKVKAGTSAIHRKGLFAKELIKKSEIIAIPGGYIVGEKEILSNPKNLPKKRYKVLKEYLFKIAPSFYLAHFSKKTLKDDDYLNHSCRPNVGVKGNLFVAMRNILKDEELTFDYAMTDNDPGIYFKCRCQEKNCRKFITGEDWKNLELQKKYKGYFAWHIQEEINKL